MITYIIQKIRQDEAEHPVSSSFLVPGKWEFPSKLGWESLEEARKQLALEKEENPSCQFDYKIIEVNTELREIP